MTRTFTVDTTPPQVSWAAPPVIRTASSTLSGTAYDPVPAGSLVASVAVQVDEATSAWRSTLGPLPPQNGTQAWFWTWGVPQEDGVTHRLRVRASDEVGNTTVTDWQSTLVDNVAPALTVTQPVTRAVLPDDIPTGGLSLHQLCTEPTEKPGPFPFSLPLLGEGGAGLVSMSHLSATPVLSGTVTDGSGVDAVRVLVYDPLGGSSTAELTVTDGRWVYAPDVTGWAVGPYALRVRTVDFHGNERVEGPYALEVMDAPIAGLTADNDGPQMIGETVTFTAAVTAGSNVTYTWAFGDASESATGRVVTHAYALDGIYSAAVTATNSASTVMTSTLVTILALTVDAGPDQTADEGATVVVNATFTDTRTTVTHAATVDWGDGTSLTDGAVDEASFTITGTHAYADGYCPKNLYQ
jgi:PKD repeat protein